MIHPNCTPKIFAEVGVRIKSSDFREAARLRILPRPLAQVIDDIIGNIVEHQRQQCFIGVEARLKYSGDQPQRPPPIIPARKQASISKRCGQSL